MNSLDLLDEAVATAADASVGWRNRTDRADVLRATAAALRDRLDEIVEILVAESGSIPAKAMFEVWGAADEFDVAADTVALTDAVDVPTADPNRTARVQRVPLGVIGVISPWNFPLLLGARSLAPALAAGNTVVLKPDPKTPRSGGDVLLEALATAGLTDGALTLVQGDAVEGQALVAHRSIGGISFTGSTEVGREIGALAGRLLKPASLELGGNNAFVVLYDADPAEAASAGAWGAFLHQGQICMASRRHLVHRSVYDEYVRELTAHAAALQVGVPGKNECQLGPVITDEAADRITSAVADAATRGATVDTAERSALQRLLPPTVITNVKPDDAIVTEETFGPVAVVIAFDDDDEAVALVNAVEHGLVAGVYTSDLARGQAIADRLDVGTVHLGDQSVNHDPRVPFAGAKASGNGHGFGGSAGIESFTRWQTITSSAPRTYPF